MEPFVPLFRNPHVQTIAAHYWKRPEAAAPIDRRLVETGHGVRVLVESQLPSGEARGHVVMVHGLEGSGQAGYIRSLSAAALGAGFAAHRFHMRTCGGTEHLCDTLYHAGLTSDLLAFLRQLGAPAFLVGFSLGGNVVLKLAGELGGNAAGVVEGVCTVSAPLDLAACARRISERDNRLYEARFVRKMLARLVATGRYTERQFADLRTVMEIDDRITAPSFGFGTAANYYRTQSAIGYLDAIRAPVLLVQSKDDTFIPFAIYESEAVRSNPAIELRATDHGGHLGFLARGPLRFWADHAIMDWIVCKHTRHSGRR